MEKRKIVHLQRIDKLLISACGIKLGGPNCGDWSIIIEEVTCKRCLKLLDKFRPMLSAITEREEYFKHAEPSCVYMSDVIPRDVHSCLHTLPSCITELPEYPGEKLKWQRSKNLLWTCLKYIKQMLLITQLFYDNSQKNSE